MGWYEVTKTIKGHQYRYMQRTYRQGGRVRTESKYIGAVAGDGSSGGSVSRKTGKDSQVVLNESHTTNTKTEPDQPQKKAPSTLLIRPDLGKTGLSPIALWRDEAGVVELMEEKGIDTSKLKPVVVSLGREVQRRRSLFTGKYIVLARHDGRYKNEFKKQFRRAMAHRWLAALEEQEPCAFEHLHTAMDTEYRATKWAVTRQILNSPSRDRYALTLHYLWSAKMPDAAKEWWKPAQVGFVDYGATPGWRFDTANLMAEVIQCGYPGTKRKYKKVLDEERVRYAGIQKRLNRMTWMQRLTGDRRKVARMLRQSQARGEAVRAQFNKVEALEMLFV